MRHSHFNTLYRNFTTQAEINAQYNAGASVPYAAACLRHYQPQATRARENLPCVLDGPTARRWMRR